MLVRKIREVRVGGELPGGWCPWLGLPELTITQGQVEAMARDPPYGLPLKIGVNVGVSLGLFVKAQSLD